jgi:NADPH-dependent curcumin reductase CurA
MANITNRELRLKRWPQGVPVPDDFEVSQTAIGAPGEGEVLVRNLYMSVDPYMRGRLRPEKSYVSSFQIGDALDGGAIGVVENSRNSDFKAGDHVLSGMGFREYFVSDGTGLTRIDPGESTPGESTPGAFPLSAFLGILGMPGRTAYVGLLEIGKLAEGETVYVSGAAGAVGAAVCQIAKIKGCRVVGSAGTGEKVRWLMEEAGVDAAFNYKDYKNLGRELRRQCPNGIDVYFDNVGGDHLEAAISNMNDFGRIVSCGMISRYNDTEATPGPSNLALIIGRRLRIQGFIVSDHPELAEPFDRDMKRWLGEDKVKWEETVIDGIEHAAEALIGLFSGMNTGKMIVRMTGGEAPPSV